jgi:hypothetical protein
MLIEDKFNKEEVITKSQIMKHVHQHKNFVERKMKWHLNFKKFKPNKRKLYKLKPTSKQRKPIPIQSSAMSARSAQEDSISSFVRREVSRRDTHRVTKHFVSSARCA